LIIGLLDPKSPSNVGSVLRAAGCYQANEVWYTGKRFARAASYQTDTKDLASKIPLRQCDDLLNSLPVDLPVVCVEFVEGAQSLIEFTHPQNALYIFGPEDGSIPQSIVDQAHFVVFVPTIGCMNLAATVNVVLYDRLAKSAAVIDHSALIKTSRDTNNRLIRDKA
jgi:tRNA(Leu) C34 or U34 (ribose-2'-O)-methylase TrmL